MRFSRFILPALSAVILSGCPDDKPPGKPTVSTPIAGYPNPSTSPAAAKDEARIIAILREHGIDCGSCGSASCTLSVPSNREAEALYLAAKAVVDEKLNLSLSIKNSKGDRSIPLSAKSVLKQGPVVSSAEPEASAKLRGQARLLTAAYEAVVQNEGEVGRAEFELPQRGDDGAWHLTLWRVPATPGSHRFIALDAEGKVTGYGRGL